MSGGGVGEDGGVDRGAREGGVECEHLRSDRLNAAVHPESVNMHDKV